MIVTIAKSSKKRHAEVDHNFRIQVTPSPTKHNTTVRVKGSQLLLAGFKTHPYGASLEKDSTYWLNKVDVVFCDDSEGTA